MKRLSSYFIFSAILSLSIFLEACDCAQAPATIAIHEPIYPIPGENVKFQLRVLEGNIQRAALYIRVDDIDPANAANPFTLGTEQLAQTWINPSGDLEHIKPEGFGQNQLVTYRFEYETGPAIPFQRKHQISFATRPYPFSNPNSGAHPAPVYAQSNMCHGVDIVFVPDTDLLNQNNAAMEASNMDEFRDGCLAMIQKAFLEEPTILYNYQNYFNFYINPEHGTATSWTTYNNNNGIPHQPPSNEATLNSSDYEQVVILHKNSFQDYYEPYSRIYSAELQNFGTMRHEWGHRIGLVHENPDMHYQRNILPNNWCSEQGAITAAPSRGKTQSDVDFIGNRPELITGHQHNWYKLCEDDCQMNDNWTATVPSRFDLPCADRIKYQIDYRLNECSECPPFYNPGYLSQMAQTQMVFHFSFQGPDIELDTLNIGVRQGVFTAKPQGNFIVETFDSLGAKLGQASFDSYFEARVCEGVTNRTYRLKEGNFEVALPYNINTKRVTLRDSLIVGDWVVNIN